ncbi:hypothetical protein [Sphingomonas sp.]|uniref:hypothetical protein n=1 Tax=Sphingomonas sp. TaxID=28214 RepID=UPI002ED9C819
MFHAPLFGRPVPPPPPFGVLPAFTPASYLALRRKAAGLTIYQLAELIAAKHPAGQARRMGQGDAQAELRALLRQLETPGVVARHADTLAMINRAMRIDAAVYRQLATAPVDAHPTICRGCGCTDATPCEAADMRPCGWAGADMCTRCTNGELL